MNAVNNDIFKPDPKGCPLSLNKSWIMSTTSLWVTLLLNVTYVLSIKITDKRIFDGGFTGRVFININLIIFQSTYVVSMMVILTRKFRRDALPQTFTKINYKDKLE